MPSDALAPSSHTNDMVHDVEGAIVTGGNKLGLLITEAIDKLGGEISQSQDASEHYKTTQTWIRSQSAQAGAGGLASGVIPVFHLVTAPLELAWFMRKLAFCGWGTGHIIARQHPRAAGLVSGKDDLIAILGLWSHQIKPEDLEDAVKVAGGVAAVGVGTATIATHPTFAAMVASKAIGIAAGHAFAIGPEMGIAGEVATHFLVAEPVATQSQMILQPFFHKVALFITSKTVAKHALPFVPFVGALAAGGVTSWFVAHLGSCAELYYQKKSEFILASN